MVNQRNLIEKLLEILPLGIIILDKNGKIIHVNSQIVDIFQITKEYLLKRGFNDSYWKIKDFTGNPLPVNELPFYIVKTTFQKVVDRRLTIEFPNGFKKYISISAGPLFDEKGDFDGMVANIADISQLKESEEKYLGAYNRAEFFKDLFAHDINNILQNIKSANELLSILRGKENFTHKFEEITLLINNQVNRGAKLVSNIRKLSKFDEEQVLTRPIDLCGVLKESISAVTKENFDKKINLRVENSIDKIFVFANEFLLDVFDNILHNAVKHNSQDTIEITIIVKRELGRPMPLVKIQFIDNGIGIPDERKQAIFRRDFYKKNVSREGMGLGLSLVKKIIESYGGEISVENKVKGDYTKGSAFSILIPEVSK